MERFKAIKNQILEKVKGKQASRSRSRSKSLKRERFAKSELADSVNSPVRQKPSSIFFCYGLDPHLDWLERRLKGITMYEDINQQVEVYKLGAYVDDVKPSITSMCEFTLVDQGSALFEAATGCELHRDSTSGKVKFLPLGMWRGTLSQEDLPVKYIVMSEHLDMIGVKLLSTFQKSKL